MRESKAVQMETSLRKKRRMRVRFYFRMAGLFLFLVCIAVVVVLNVDVFKVKIVEVTGVKRVSAEKVYVSSNISVGENLFLLPVGDIRSNIIDQFPLIKNVEIHRIVPSRVRIKVLERIPYAYVTDGQNFYVIDRERIVLDKPHGIAKAGMFKIVTDGLRHADVGEKLDFPYYRIFGRMNLLINEVLSGQYRQVMFSERGIKLFLKDGTYVLLGNGTDLEKKIRLIPLIMKELKGKNRKYEGLNLATLEAPSYIKKASLN